MEPQPLDVQRGAEHGLPQGGVSPDHPWEQLALLFFTMKKRTEQEGPSPAVRSSPLPSCLVLLPPPTVPSSPHPNPHPARGTPGSLPTRRKAPSSQSPGYHPLSRLSLLIHK